MPVVLRREELVGRRERIAYRPDVDDAPCRPAHQRHLVGQVGERDEGLFLRQGGKRPIGEAEDAQSGESDASLDHVPAGGLSRHVAFLRAVSEGVVNQRAIHSPPTQPPGARYMRASKGSACRSGRKAASRLTGWGIGLPNGARERRYRVGSIADRGCRYL